MARKLKIYQTSLGFFDQAIAAPSQAKWLALTATPRLGFHGGKTRITMTCNSETLDTLLRTLERSQDLRKQRETLSSVSLACFGGISSELPLRVLQVLADHRIVPTNTCCRRTRSACLSLWRAGKPLLKRCIRFSKKHRLEA